MGVFVTYGLLPVNWSSLATRRLRSALFTMKIDAMRGRWIVLCFVFLLLIATFAWLVPFKQVDIYLDRRTGILTGELSYFHIPAGPFELYNLKPDLLQHNTAIATRKILVQKMVFRSPWSLPDRISYPSYDYVTAFKLLFTALEDEDLEPLLPQRTLVWNSTTLDDDPLQVISRYEQENKQIRSSKTKSPSFPSPH